MVNMEFSPSPHQIWPDRSQSFNLDPTSSPFSPITSTSPTPIATPTHNCDPLTSFNLSSDAPSPSISPRIAPLRKLSLSLSQETDYQRARSGSRSTLSSQPSTSFSPFFSNRASLETDREIDFDSEADSRSVEIQEFSPDPYCHENGNPSLSARTSFSSTFSLPAKGFSSRPLARSTLSLNLHFTSGAGTNSDSAATSPLPPLSAHSLNGNSSFPLFPLAHHQPSPRIDQDARFEAFEFPPVSSTHTFSPPFTVGLSPFVHSTKPLPSEVSPAHSSFESSASLEAEPVFPPGIDIPSSAPGIIGFRSPEEPSDEINGGGESKHHRQPRQHRRTKSSKSQKGIEEGFDGHHDLIDSDVKNNAARVTRASKSGKLKNNKSRGNRQRSRSEPLSTSTVEEDLITAEEQLQLDALFAEVEIDLNTQFLEDYFSSGKVTVKEKENNPFKETFWKDRKSALGLELFDGSEGQNQDSSPHYEHQSFAEPPKSTKSLVAHLNEILDPYSSSCLDRVKTAKMLEEDDLEYSLPSPSKNGVYPGTSGSTPSSAGGIAIVKPSDRKTSRSTSPLPRGQTSLGTSQLSNSASASDPREGGTFWRQGAPAKSAPDSLMLSSLGRGSGVNGRDQWESPTSPSTHLASLGNGEGVSGGITGLGAGRRLLPVRSFSSSQWDASADVLTSPSASPIGTFGRGSPLPKLASARRASDALLGQTASSGGGLGQWMIGSLPNRSPFALGLGGGESELERGRASFGGGSGLPDGSVKPREPSVGSQASGLYGRTRNSFSAADGGGINHSNMSPFTRDGAKLALFSELGNEAGNRSTGLTGRSQLRSGAAKPEYSLGAMGLGRRRETIWGGTDLRRSRPEEGGVMTEEAIEGQDEEDEEPKPTSGATSRRHSVATFGISGKGALGLSIAMAPSQTVPHEKQSAESLVSELNSLHLSMNEEDGSEDGRERQGPKSGQCQQKSPGPGIQSLPQLSQSSVSRGACGWPNRTTMGPASPTSTQMSPGINRVSLPGGSVSPRAGSFDLPNVGSPTSAFGPGFPISPNMGSNGGFSPFPPFPPGMPPPSGLIPGMNMQPQQLMAAAATANRFGPLPMLAGMSGMVPVPAAGMGIPPATGQSLSPLMGTYFSGSMNGDPSSPTQGNAAGLAANQENSDLGKGIPLHSVPQNAPLFIIEFKAGRTDLFYAERVDSNIRISDLVIVEADRGKDLGKVRHDSVTLEEVQAFQQNQVEMALGQLASPQLAGTQPPNPATITKMTKEIHPKRLFGKASQGDVNLLVSKVQDEAKALALCRSKVMQKGLPMEVTDAEWQFDRRKLTFFFVADRRVDFRELVRDLFRTFKTRIWMCLLTPEGIAPAVAPPES